MKKIFVFTLVTALALCAAEVYPAEPNKKAQDANRLAREGADAAKNQDWDKAVELLRSEGLVRTVIGRGIFVSRPGG